MPALGRQAPAKTNRPCFYATPDVQLMMRTKAGDDDAFSQLVASYQDRLLSIFYHMLRDQGAAEDLVQEVFLRIYRARLGYQPTAKFSTWVFRIANNVASNARRTIGRRREVSLNTPAGIRLGPGRSPQDRDERPFVPASHPAGGQTGDVRNRSIRRRHAQ